MKSHKSMGQIKIWVRGSPELWVFIFLQLQRMTQRCFSLYQNSGLTQTSQSLEIKYRAVSHYAVCFRWHTGFLLSRLQTSLTSWLSVKSQWQQEAKVCVTGSPECSWTHLTEEESCWMCLCFSPSICCIYSRTHDCSASQSCVQECQCVVKSRCVRQL